MDRSCALSLLYQGVVVQSGDYRYFLVIVFAALFASGQPVSIFPTFLYQFLIQFGIVTLIFAVADHHWTKFPERWDPRSLKGIWPDFTKHPGSTTETSSTLGTTPRISRFDSIAQFVALGVSIAWLRVVQQAPFMIFGPAAAFVKPAPVWHQFYLPVVLLALAGMVQAGVNLLRPDWVRLHYIYSIVCSIGWLLICFFLLKAGNVVVLVDLPGSPAFGYLRTVAILNQSFYFCLWGVVIASAVNLFRHLRRFRKLSRGSHSRVPSPSS